MINKIIEYQISNKKTEVQVCQEIGITPRTLYNARTGRTISTSTEEKINNFIEKEGL